MHKKLSGIALAATISLGAPNVGHSYEFDNWGTALVTAYYCKQLAVDMGNWDLAESMDGIIDKIIAANGVLSFTASYAESEALRNYQDSTPTVAATLCVDYSTPPGWFDWM